MEKDQKPTPKRLRDARRRGEVVFSADVASTTVFAVVVIGLWLMGHTVVGLLRELWLQATSGAVLGRPDQRIAELGRHSTQVLLWVCVGITGLAAVAGIAGSFFQVGGVAAWERLKPDVNRLNPALGFKRIFSTRNLVNLLKMVAKTALLAALMVVVIRAYISPAMRLGYLEPEGALAVGAHALLMTFAWAAVIYVAMALVDYAHQHYEFMKEQRMSIEEVRREFKENEGDPVNLSRRRSAHFEAVYASLGDRVRGASAVIHSQRVAVALQYLGDKDLPRVVARGEGEVAAQIRRFAADALIPVEADAGLAERLYEEVPVEQHIPRALYAPVAKLLRWAQGLDA
jgi:type III secretion protein U